MKAKANMSEKMKIVIAYDGSASANGVFEDLNHAGLPEKCEALVISVADVFIPPPLNEKTDKAVPRYTPQGIKRAHQHAERKLKEAADRAVHAVERIQKLFPEWQVKDLAVADSPAWAILRAAEEWKAELIIMGAQGHSVLGGRLILGSISQRVLYEALSSVRIARTRNLDRSALRLVIGVDNSPYSHAAVETVSRRPWPKGTQVRLLNVVDTVMAVPVDPLQPALQGWLEADDENGCDEVAKIFEPDADKLRQAGLHAEVTIRKGNPTDEILEEAETWNADCILLGPKGVRGIERLLLGSVSSAVAARARCSVEIVRDRSGNTGGVQQ
jgi:nucleotide-binding universal stress UspA family protein